MIRKTPINAITMPIGVKKDGFSSVTVVFVVIITSQAPIKRKMIPPIIVHRPTKLKVILSAMKIYRLKSVIREKP
jgi:hypothetical protein